MTTIVRFDCGCIGTAPESGRSSILSACDGDDGGPGMSDRDMSSHTYEPVDYRVQVWADASDAYAYRELQGVLRRTVKE